MRRRLLSWCLLAYPWERRRHDGAVLRDLALDLGDSHGFAREAVSLIRAGVADRIASWSIRRRAMVVALVIGVITAAALPAVGGAARDEVEQLACTRQACNDTARRVAALRKDGWECRSTRPRTDEVVGWECSLS